ncbi:ribonuclease 3 [Actinomycetota bacterium]|nr:ribonuclease 3 [Actinomycetota bacterium]
MLKKLGVYIAPELLITALTHPSFANENAATSWEKIEFLGDTVLNFIIGTHIYEKFPDESEGGLTGIKAQIVSTTPLAQVARKLGLEHFILLGKGLSAKQLSDHNLEDCFEALVAAIYLSNDIGVAQDFVQKTLGQTIVRIGDSKRRLDYRTELALVAKELRLGTPQYKTVEVGSVAKPKFSTTIEFSDFGVFKTSAIGGTKKQSALKAAKVALDKASEYKKHTLGL